MANINYNIWKGIKDNISLISSHIIVFRAIIGATWFWILGAFFMTEMFPLCSKVLNTEKEVVTMFLVLFSFGVGVGSIFCNKLLKGEVSVVYVPISAIGLSVCAFAIYLLSVTFPKYENLISLVEFLLTSHLWRNLRSSPWDDVRSNTKPCSSVRHWHGNRNLRRTWKRPGSRRCN